MRKSLLLASAAMMVALPLVPAHAFFHAGGWSGAHGFAFHDSRGGWAAGGNGSWAAHGYRGGTASGSDGSWNATGYRGSTASGNDGWWNAHGYQGGNASGGHGSWSATGSNGQTYYGGPDYYHGGYYGPYVPPPVVPYYGVNCYNCGGWNSGDAMAVGLMAGTTMGAAASANASNQAYVAGVAAGQASVLAANPPGTLYGTLPAGCTYSPVGGVTYYHCTTGLWFAPAWGANGTYYRVVATP
jgi:hypothetical protein